MAEAYIPTEEEIYALLAEQQDWPDEEIEARLEILAASEDEILQFSCPTTIEFGERICGFVPNRKQLDLGLNWYTDQQKQIWDSVEANSNTIVFSGNGIGKTLALALEVLHRYFQGYKVITTAPVKRQVANLWSEIRTLKEMAHGRGITLPGRWSPRAFDVEITPKWTMHGYTARVASGEAVATAFQGEHGAKVFLAMDELVGVPEPIWEAADRLLVGENDKFLGCGNPTEPTAYAAKAARMVDKMGKRVYNVIHMSSEDHPNVVHELDIIPGATSRKFCEKQFAKGGSRESAIYRTSVLGLFPNQAEDALIRAEWIEAAKHRAEEMVEDQIIQERSYAQGRGRRIRKFPPDHKGVALGLDVAGEGRDLTVLMACENGKLFYPKLRDKAGNTLPCWHRGRDHTHATELLVQGILQIPRVLAVSIDDTGLGAAVSAELWKRSQREFPEIPIYITKGPLASPEERRTKCSITRINFGSSPAGGDSEMFGSMKDSLWWTFREALRLNKITLPTETEQREVGFPDESDLFAQIIAPIMWQDSKGKMHILDKQSAYGGKGREVSKFLPTLSPDQAHSALLAVWSWFQLPERYAAPETTAEVFQVKKDAEIEASLPKQTAYYDENQKNLRPFQRRAR